MSQERVTDLLFGMIWPPTSSEGVRQSVIDTLTELEALRGKDKGLTEEEFAGWRTSILDELATNRHPESVYLIACIPLSLFLVALLTYALPSGKTALVWGAGGTLVLLALMVVRFARGLRAKKRLTVGERLELVAELARRELVSTDEAVELGARIARLTPSESG